MADRYVTAPVFNPFTSVPTSVQPAEANLLLSKYIKVPSNFCISLFGVFHKLRCMRLPVTKVGSTDHISVWISAVPGPSAAWAAPAQLHPSLTLGYVYIQPDWCMDGPHHQRCVDKKQMLWNTKGKGDVCCHLFAYLEVREMCSLCCLWACEQAFKTERV